MGTEYFIYRRSGVPNFVPVLLRFTRETVLVDRMVEGQWEPDLSNYFLRKVLLGDSDLTIIDYEELAVL
jgi:hypothetical protein